MTDAPIAPENPMMVDRAAARRPKLEGGKHFIMHTNFAPAGDQQQRLADPVRR